MKRSELADKYQTVNTFHMRDIPKNDEISAGLVSDRCQFCGATFNRADQLSLHYKEKHLDKMGQKGDTL